MKTFLPTATMTAAILILASPTLVGTNAIGAPSSVSPASAVNGPRPSPTPIKTFKLKCLGIGETLVEISDVGDAPVPAGTIAQWLVPAGPVTIQGQSYTFAPHSGSYTFQKPLDPGGQVQVMFPTPPVPSSTQNVPIESSLAVGLLFPGLLTPRNCVISVGPIRSPVHLQVVPH
jgi:hypothetical protein